MYLSPAGCVATNLDPEKASHSISSNLGLHCLRRSFSLRIFTINAAIPANTSNLLNFISLNQFSLRVIVNVLAKKCPVQSLHLSTTDIFVLWANKKYQHLLVENAPYLEISDIFLFLQKKISISCEYLFSRVALSMCTNNIFFVEM